MIVTKHAIQLNDKKKKKSYYSFTESLKLIIQLHICILRKGVHVGTLSSTWTLLSIN